MLTLPAGLRADPYLAPQLWTAFSKEYLNQMAGPWAAGAVYLLLALGLVFNAVMLLVPLWLAVQPLAWLLKSEVIACDGYENRGRNVLVVGQQEELSMALMASSIISIAAQAPNAKFIILDGTPADSPLAGVMPRVRDALGAGRVDLVEYRATEEAIAELAAELQRRETEGGANPPPIFLLVYGLQRYRALRKSEDSSFSFGARLRTIGQLFIWVISTITLASGSR